MLTDDLLELQRIDTTVDQLAHRRSALTERTAHRDAVSELSRLNRRRAEIEARTAELEAAIGGLEEEGAAIGRHRTRLEGQLRTVIAPREAEALMHEIDTLTTRRDGLDDQELAFLEEQSTLADESSSIDASRPSISAAVDGASGALIAAESAIDDEVAALSSARAELVASIDPTVLAQYERLRARYGGVAVGRLDASRCTGCHLDLSRAEVDAVRAVGAGELADCPQCGRMLVP